jgi:hypothetical protein
MLEESMSKSEPGDRQSGTVTKRAPRDFLPLVLLGLPVTLYLLLTAWSVPYVDPIRDANQAWSIAHAQERPLIGPQVAQLIHLGPIWFYLLSLPAAVASSMLGLSLFIGALAASKFLFAYWFGRRLVDERTGLYLAFGLMLPTWSFWQFLFLTHAVMVEAAMLASGLLFLAYLDRPGVVRAMALGLALGLGLHAHPTFVLVAPGLLALLVWHGGWRRARLAHVLLALVVILCLFLPSLVGQWTDAEGSVQRLSRFAETDLGSGGAREMLATAWSLISSGVQASFGLALPGAPGAAAHAVWLAWLVLLGAAWLTAWRFLPAGERRLWFGALGSLLAALLILSFLRSRTPWYMTWALMPLLATWLAVTLHGLGRQRLTRWMPSASLALLLLFQVIAVFGFIQRIERDAELSIPAANLFDATHTRLEWSEPGLAIASRHAREMGDYLCAHPGRSFGGILGKVLDERDSIDALLACGARGALRVGPCGDDAVLGLPHSAWRRLGMAPDERLAVAGLLSGSRLTCLAGGPSLPMADGTRYPFRPVFPGPVQEQASVFRLESAQWLAVINQFPVLNPFGSLTVRAAGRPMTPVWSDRSTSIYRCASCGEVVEWRVEYEAAAPAQVYLLALGPD